MYIRFQAFVDEINSVFIQKAPEMMQAEFEREGVKLHATLMNSKFLGKKTGELELFRGRKRECPVELVDATRVFQVNTSWKYAKYVHM